jgi:hypothetical protein
MANPTHPWEIPRKRGLYHICGFCSECTIKRRKRGREEKGVGIDVANC